MFFHILLVHTMRLLHGVGPACRFHLHCRRIRDFQSVKKRSGGTEGSAGSELLFVLLETFHLPEESAWLGRFSSVNLFDS